MKFFALKTESLLLLLSIIISIFFVLYLTYHLNFTQSTNFFEVLKDTINFNNAKYPLSLYLKLLLNSTMLVVICLTSGFFLGFWLSKYEILSSFFNILAAVPELLIAIFLRSIVWDPVKNAENQLAKGFIICVPIILRNTAAMYKYFKLAREKYTQTYFFYLSNIRNIKFFKRLRYLMQSTFLDAMSNTIYEFPLLISYVAVLERIFEFRGLSRQLLNNLIYGNPYELFRFTLLILVILVIFQSIFLAIIRSSDKR